MKRILAWTAAVIVVALYLLLILGPALAHDWYPIFCCRGTEVGGDCAPIPASRVKHTKDGYVIDGQFTVPNSEVRWSPDGQYHACFYPSPNDLRCFFAPLPSM